MCQFVCLVGSSSTFVQRAAAVPGAHYADTCTSSKHEACQLPGTWWIEPLGNPISAFPVHPDATGEAVMAQDALRQIRR